MATVATRFECLVPMDSGNGTPSDLAVEAFKSSLSGLTNFSLLNIYVNTAGVIQQFDLIFGLLTPTQANTALGFLGTLNAALGHNITCYIWSVTTEP